MKEKQNLIYLKRDETSEFCLLGSSDKVYLRQWLSVLCKNCGFSEIYSIKSHEKTSKSTEKKTLRDLLNLTETTKKKSNNFLIRKSKDLQQSLAGNLNNLKNSNNKSAKTIAGKAALSVGSFDLCNNPILDVLFKKHYKENKIEKFNYLNLINIPASPQTIKESYLCLEQCVSGNSPKKLKNHFIEIDQVNPDLV